MSVFGTDIDVSPRCFRTSIRTMGSGWDSGAVADMGYGDGNRPKRPIAKTAPMKVENGPRVLVGAVLVCVTQTKTAPTKTVPMKEKTRPKRPQRTSKTAHSHVQNGPLRNIVQISDK